MKETIGLRIKNKRKEMDMTQEDLAEKLGVTFQAISKWENDASIPDITLLSKIAEVLNMNIEELINGIKSSSDESKKTIWGNITGTITKDIHGDVGKIIGEVKSDIYGNVNGNIIGSTCNIYGNVEGNITGTVVGNITGYIKGNLYGTVTGSVKGGVRGKIFGIIIEDGINVPEDKDKLKKLLEKNKIKKEVIEEITASDQIKNKKVEDQSE